MSTEARLPSPLSGSDNLDVVRELKDGGVDMIVSTAGPLDASDDTCERLHEKLSVYLYAATHPNFPNVYSAARDGRVRIFVSDSHPISERARVVIEKFAVEALSRDVEVHIGGPVD